MYTIPLTVHVTTVVCQLLVHELDWTARRFNCSNYCDRFTLVWQTLPASCSGKLSHKLTYIRQLSHVTCSIKVKY